MNCLSRLLLTDVVGMAKLSRFRLLPEIYLLSALSQTLVSGNSRSLQSHCSSHALPGYHIDAPKNASYPYKALCEVVFKQNYFHREQSGGCYSTFSGDKGLPWTDIDFETLTDMIKSKEIQLFDVREPSEVRETGMMPGATNVPLGQVPEAFKLSAEDFKNKYGAALPNKLDKNIVFSCLGGVRSRRAMNAAHEAGFTRSRHYIGGWEEYSEKIKLTSMSRPWTDIDFEELMKMIKAKDIQLFDVRQLQEILETGMMPSAVNIPLGELQEALQLPARDFKERYGVNLPDKTDVNIVFTCRSGNRSRQAVTTAHEAGFRG